ncbi:MAG: hypothetical protein HQL80_03575 [Magnetococcales bacterium]|nr:hypothetical protein [Magnetococcales bacterium]
MNSTAILAKGSKLEIGTATGSANAVTAIGLSNPCRVTLESSIADLRVGDVVTLAGIVGTTQLNGNNYVVQYLEPGNKVITLAGVDATGFTPFESGGTLTPVSLTRIANLLSYSGFDGEAEEVDVTHMESTAHEVMLGLPNEGSFTMEFDYNAADSGQIALKAAKNSGAKKSFKLTCPDGSTATFAAFVKKFSKSGDVKGVQKGSCTLRITGTVIDS